MSITFYRGFLLMLVYILMCSLENSGSHCMLSIVCFICGLMHRLDGKNTLSSNFKTTVRPAETLYSKEHPIRINAVYLIFSLKMKKNKFLQRT